ncbi:GGDEF domain-containing protein [Pigmentiphaga sp.]|uniref:GGDEF domain-containing protein n=1 Tax=Pigmentiphaga sp. TaxID=1977564 RepID=UPI0025F49442|nr:GGDEF domain-containing protein [Pigmentiphaga sp.]MBX6318954.1 GGDEF domain-containing protein [Pigmentiphaga sp.]
MKLPAPFTVDQLIVFGHAAAALLFAGFALCIWNHARSRRYLLLYALAFGLYAGAALLAAPQAPVFPLRLAAATLYVASVLALTRGMLARGEAQTDAAPLTALGIGLFALLAYFDLVERDAAALAYTLGMGTGSLLLLAWMRLSATRPAGLEDRIAHWGLLVLIAGHLLGTALTARTAGGVFPGAGLAQSPDTMLASLGMLVLLGGTQLAAAWADVVTSLKRERITDPQTLLLNRRNFEESGYSDVQRDAARPSALILLDLDHFKQINDSYGHMAGDAALAEVGRIIRQCVRHGDLAWRLGGDEFAVLMSGASNTSAAQAADRMRMLLAQTRVMTPRGTFTLTASFGIAQSRMKEPLYDLFARADRKLYEAKRQGKNRIAAESTPEKTCSALAEDERSPEALTL